MKYQCNSAKHLMLGKKFLSISNHRLENGACFWISCFRLGDGKTTWFCQKPPWQRRLFFMSKIFVVALQKLKLIVYIIIPSMLLASEVLSFQRKNSIAHTMIYLCMPSSLRAEIQSPNKYLFQETYKQTGNRTFQSSRNHPLYHMKIHRN